MFTKTLLWVVHCLQGLLRPWMSFTHTLVGRVLLKISYRRPERQFSADPNEVEFILYYGDLDSDAHHILWNPVFAQYAGRYVSVFRHEGAFFRQQSQGDDAVLVLSPRQLEHVYRMFPNLKAVFYPANNGSNIASVSHSDVRHIFLGHGDSAKASSASKVFRLYDEVWVSGQAHIDRFSDVTGDFSSLMFRKVGQPWMRDFQKNLQERATQDIDNIGYFPTWAGHLDQNNYASVHLVKQLEAALVPLMSSQAHLHIKPHPWTKIPDVQALQNLATQVPNGTCHCGTARLRDVLALDIGAVICDNSAALTECLYLQVPIFLYENAAKKYPSAFRASAQFCYVFHDVDTFTQLYLRVIKGGKDPLKEDRKQALAHFVEQSALDTDLFEQSLMAQL